MAEQLKSSDVIERLVAAPESYMSEVLGPIMEADIDVIQASLAEAEGADTLRRLCYVLAHRETGDSHLASAELLDLLAHQDAGIRAEAADALSHIASGEGRLEVYGVAPDACHRLNNALSVESDGYARAMLAAAIGDLACTGSEDLLIGLLSDKSADARREAARSLGLLGSGRTEIETAIERELDSTASDVMREALERLG